MKTNALWLRVGSFFAALVLLFSLMLHTGGTQTLSKLGTSGEEVRQIQTKLKNWGYYTGAVDGLFGPSTRDAVVSFQKKNGLTPDGICGTKTLAAIAARERIATSLRSSQ